MMEHVVLDTDVCSFLLKQDSRAESYRSHLANKTFCLSFQTVAELYLWSELRGWGERRRAEMDAWLRRFVVLPYDDETSRAWARIRASGHRRGRPITAQDAWVAAGAMRHACPLVTHNAAHYSDVDGLTILTIQ